MSNLMLIIIYIDANVFFQDDYHNVCKIHTDTGLATAVCLHIISYL